MKPLTRFAIGLLLIGAVVYGCHWVGVRFSTQLGIPVNYPAGLQRDIILTIWGGLSAFMSVVGTIIGVTIAHSIGKAIYRDPKTETNDGVYRE